MKQYQVRISRTALGDMEEIYNYIANHLQERETAMRQYDRIADAIQSLGMLPGRCPLLDCEPERSQRLRRLLVDHYAVFYVVGEDTVSVARVLYSSSDIVYRLRNMK